MFGLIAIAAVLLQQAPPDTTAVRAAARRAEAAYERAARRHAPLVGWRGSSGECHEVVGRFCLRYDDGAPEEPPPEPARITDARREAIDALRRGFTLLPGDPALAGPLVRLLIEDERPREAVAIALTYEALASDSADAALLAGLTLHAAGEETSAAGRFERALEWTHAGERDRVPALDWLLQPAERRRYRSLPDAERRRYEAAVWTLADPLYLSAVNERWVEHVARYAYARLLERAPLVRDMHRWGRDMEELLMRYGAAYRRGRELSARIDESGIVEYFDPRQLAYVPETLLARGYPPPPLPGDSWPLGAERARSGYAPRTIRSMDALPHQLTRIPVRGGWLVRVDATFGLDSVARVPPPPLPGVTAARPAPVPGPMHTGLFLQAAAHAMDRAAEVRGTTMLAPDDSARITLAVLADAGEYVYSAEAFESETRTARRARYALELPSAYGLRASDVLIAEPFRAVLPDAHSDRQRLRPLTRLVFGSDATIGIYAEIVGLETGAYHVEVLARSADRRSLPVRVVRWLGAALGRGKDDTPPRVRWSGIHEDDDTPLVIALDLPLAGLERGLHIIEIAVVNGQRGERAAAQRIIRIE